MLRLTSFLKTNAILFSLVIALSICSILTWTVLARIDSFKSYHQSIAQHAVDNVAVSIPAFIQERQRLIKLFVEQNRSSIQKLVQSPDDTDGYERLGEQLKEFFPQSHAFTIASQDGVPLFDDFDGKILDTCLNDIKFFSRVNQYQPYVHPHPELYHFDIMYNMSMNFQPYIFFISFEADILAPFLKSVQTQGHQVMLVYPENNMLLEVTALGARNHHVRDDYRLSEDEQRQFLARKKVNSTRWDVVDSYIPELFVRFKQQQINHALVIGFVILFFLSLMTRRIYQDQQQLLYRETALIDLSNNLGDEVEQRTREIEKEFQLRQQQEQYLLQEEQVASLGRMVSGVAHEINGPLGSAVMGISLIKLSTQEIKTAIESDQLSKPKLVSYVNDTREMCQTIEVSLNNAATLVKSFKVVSVEQTHEQLRHFNLGEYIEDVLRSMRKSLSDSNIELTIDCDPKIELNSYPGYFSQIINNLINNSIMHAFPSGENDAIQISFSQQGERLSIIYQDNGNGIPANHLKKIFNPFFSTKREAGGTGQGMFIVARIIQTRLKGSIHCDSAIGKGVRFDIEVQKDFLANAED